MARAGGAEEHAEMIVGDAEPTIHLLQTDQTTEWLEVHVVLEIHPCLVDLEIDRRCYLAWNLSQTGIN